MMMRTIFLGLIGVSMISAVSAAHAAPASCTSDKTGGDDGIENDFHRKHLGEIVFAKEAIDRKSATDAMLVKRFTVSDPLYLRPFLAHSLGNTCIFNDKGGQLDSHGGYQVSLTIDGKALAEPMIYRELSSDAARTWTTFRLAFNPRPDDTDQKRDDQARWADVVSALAPGEHAVRVQIWAVGDAAGSRSSKQPIAEGEFVLVTKAGDAVAGTATLPKPAKRDAALEKSMLAAITSAGWEEKPLKVVITDPDWTIERDHLGTVVARKIGTMIAVKTTAGKCRKFSLSFAQERTGTTYGTTKLDGVGK